MTLQTELRELMALSEKATPGPWTYEGVFDEDEGYSMHYICDQDTMCDATTLVTFGDGRPNDEYDARTIVAAVNFLRTHGATLLEMVEDAEKWRAVSDMFASFGPHRYMMQTIPRRGTRCVWVNPPPAGTRILAVGNGEDVEVETTSIEMAGMVGYMIDSGMGFMSESCAFPSELKYVGAPIK